ncbi:recombinase family protein [Mesorhizobium sp. B1-1-8]|uniref:recombinase family protein n=1 Tax=Mesorhizobium sp. B1-1-8 TaxID=2589976 RepID=UPI001127ED27|nr:recombinase family protein [Mesorhizobium sp. B1-1-8]UCI07338.1 recombinase family protein [Mesorhizobium sp. B1-1-8]
MQTCFAYIRVSTVKQGTRGVSLQEQRSAIEAYSLRNQINIQEWFEERETAAKRGRPVFTKMLGRLDRGEASGVVIHKIDRSARNLRDWADLGELIDKGVQVYFATESLDLASRGGRLSADIQAVVAADYIRNLREETRKGFYGRLKQGLYPLQAPLGYLDTGKGKPKAVDPVRAPLIKRAFELYASGTHTLQSLRKELKSLGLVNKGGKPLTLGTLSHLLNNSFYAGLIRLRSKGDTFQGVHEPLISMHLFLEVADILHGRAPKRKYKHDMAFRRIITCRTCGGHLTGERQKGRVYYRCHGDECKGTSVREDDVEVSVREALNAIEITTEEHSLLLTECTDLRSVQMQRHSDLLQTLDARIQATKVRLDRLVDALLDGLIDRQTALSRRESLLSELIEIEQQRARLAGNPEQGFAEVVTLLEHSKLALHQYEIGTRAEKREVLKIVTSNLKLVEKNVVVELRNPFRLIAEHRKVDRCDPSCGTVRTALVHKLFDLISEERKLVAANDNAQLNPGMEVDEGGKIGP